MHVCRAVATLAACVIALVSGQAVAAEANANLIQNSTLEQTAGNKPVGFEISGATDYGPLGDARRDIVSRGFSLHSNQPSGEASCTVTGVKSGSTQADRWYRFTVRGLPQANFSVGDDDLYLKVSFFGDGGKTGYDSKARKIYEQIDTARKDMAVNGVRHRRGAEVWQSYQIDFCLPFPQVDTLKLAVGFSHGAATSASDANFLVDDFSLVAIPAPDGLPKPPTEPVAIVPAGKLLPIAGRWFYAGGPGESAPKTFNASNVDRLLYHDNIYSAPFAGNVSAWLRAGNMDAAGNVLKQDRLIADNVTISFDSGSMVVHTKNVPNHPTGRFPEQGFGNPSYIQEQDLTYYFPLEPKENPQHRVTDAGNANRALHMGPIGLATNGVVFFNPFDMGNTDATDLMDRCCGHPNQDGLYHYHKYPICVNSPWADEGHAHSPLLGWAFDGYPVYGPYERDGVMAKDIAGDNALNGFNMHYDADRGWHYHVTPGKFPYLIGGFWGVEDTRDNQRPRHGRGQGGNMNGPPGAGPGGDRGGAPGGGPGGRRGGPPPFGPPPFDGPPG